MHTTRKAVVAAVSILAVTACGGESDNPDDATEPSVTVRLVIPDGNIREPGVSCSGASAFRFAHPQAQFAVRDPSGTTVATGELPQGVAEKAFTIDLGDDQRQPTVCVMSIEVAGVRSVDDHTLVISDHSPVPIRPNPNLDDIPEAVLS